MADEPTRLRDYGLQSERLLWPTKGQSRFEQEMGADELERALGLTPREAEVLTLVARGYTNREIAGALVISVKTASVHVSHILSKIDAPNRREAAAIAHRIIPPEADWDHGG